MEESETLMSPISVNSPGFFLKSIRLLGISLIHLLIRWCALGKLRLDDSHSFQPHGFPGIPSVSWLSVHPLHELLHESLFHVSSRITTLPLSEMDGVATENSRAYFPWIVVAEDQMAIVACQPQTHAVAEVQMVTTVY